MDGKNPQYTPVFVSTLTKTLVNYSTHPVHASILRARHTTARWRRSTYMHGSSDDIGHDTPYSVLHMYVQYSMYICAIPYHQSHPCRLVRSTVHTIYSTKYTVRAALRQKPQCSTPNVRSQKAVAYPCRMFQASTSQFPHTVLRTLSSSYSTEYRIQYCSTYRCAMLLRINPACILISRWLVDGSPEKYKSNCCWLYSIQHSIPSHSTYGVLT